MEGLYNTYSDYLRGKYGEKVYKLPINLPVTCPNRDGSKGYGGCLFCGEKGAGFENLSSFLSVSEQLKTNMGYIRRKYNAGKFIAYFQTYTSTYLPVQSFAAYVAEACQPDIVAVAVSTRPDCIGDDYLTILAEIKQRYGIDIDIELGLQTANDETLLKLNRGHNLADFIDAVKRIKSYGFSVCAHLIPDLPWDTLADVINTAKLLSELQVDQVKLHSLYVVRNTELAYLYERGEIKLLTMEDYIERVSVLIAHLDPKIVLQRLVGRAPKEDTLVVNWHTSWWKIKDKIEERMREQGFFQGCALGVTKQPDKV